MTALEHETDQKIVADVLPVELDEPAVPVELDTLQPWHRPRKQFIRERQWIFLSSSLIEEGKNTPGLPVPAIGLPEVRCLTLPGIDYLDVRLLADSCRKLGCCLTNTGFLAGSERNPNVARAKVREDSLIKAGHITHNSHTFRRRLEEIAAAHGQANRDLQRKGPFHIVNLDVCGSIASPSAQHPNRLIEAIYRIVEFQLAYKTGSWLLFVSTDVRHDSIETTTLCRLCDAMLANAKKNTSFRSKVLSMLDREKTDIEEATAEAFKSPGEKFLKLFSLSFAKWLLHLAHTKNWEIKMHTAYCYSTEVHGNDVPTMACLAFEFLPPPPGLQDDFQVVRVEPAIAGNPDDTSIRAFTKVASMENLDRRMQVCQTLRKNMAERTRELLKEAGYSESVLMELQE